MKSKFMFIFRIFSLLNKFTEDEGSFIDFYRSYKKFGLNINEDGDLVYREWAPGAAGLSLVSNYFVTF